MTHAELLTLESDHPDLVAAILACAKVGSGRIEVEIDKTELGLIARTMETGATQRERQAWQGYNIHELNLTYLELDINLYAKVAIR